MLLYVETAAAHIRSQNQNAAIIGRALHLYDPSFLREMRNMHDIACRKHPLTLDAFLLNELLQTKTSSLLMENRI